MSRRHSSTWAVVLALLTGCSAFNKVDVCETPPSTSLTLNHRFEGIQKTGSPSASVPLPGGGAMVVFASEVPGRDLAEVTELRSVRLTAEGAKLQSCDKNDTLDDVLVAADPTNPAKQLREQSWVAAPAGPNRPGLLVYVATEEGRPTELWGLFFESDGCPYGSGSDRRKTFLIATVPAADELFGPSALSLGVGKDQNDFLVLWEVLSGSSMQGYARVLRETPSGPEYLATALAPDGSAAKLPSVPDLLYGLAPALVGENVVIAAHYSTTSSPPDSHVVLWFFDDHLRMLSAPVQVSQGDPRGELLLGRHITVAYDGRTILVGWSRNDSNGKVRVFSRAFDPEGRARGPALRLGTEPAATDNFPTVMAWPDHGFLFAWRQEGGRAETAGPRILGRVLDSAGQPAFTGRACGEEPFVIAHQSDGDRRQPNVVGLQSNDVLATWTDDTKKSTDTSGSSIQGRLLPLETLFVGKPRPGGPKSAPPPAPPRGPDAGAPPDAEPVIMCETDKPGTQLGGDKCLCDSDCETGASCGIELAAGFPGGSCIKSCNPTMTGTDQCGVGRQCRGVGTNGFCWNNCATHADCGPGRACQGKPRYCVPFCASDEECRSGHCDLYRGLCAATANEPTGAGLMEPCLRHDDCKSRQCVTNKCVTTCHPAKSMNCPANGVCVPYPDGDGGLCLPECGPGDTCPMNTTCRTMTGMPKKVCL
jgi:hypothetical protein